MDFAEFRKQNAEKAPATPEKSEPANSSSAGETEKEHQNKDLLKMKNAGVWIPRGPNVKTPGLHTEEKVHHKVKVHYGDHSEVKYVDDDELGVLRKSNRVTKVTQLGAKKGEKVLEYVEEANQSAAFAHADGRKAYIDTHKYTDPSLGTDHYVHIDKTRATVYSHDEGLTKAHKLLKKLGFKPVKAE